MIPVQTVVMIYFTFAVLCAMPWTLDWATHGSFPVTSRLLSLLIFSWTLMDCGWFLWTVHDEMPERIMDALSLLFPMMIFSVFGVVLVTKSLVKLVKQSKQEENE